MVPLKASLRDVLGTVLLSSISHDLIKNADSPMNFFPFPVREKIQNNLGECTEYENSIRRFQIFGPADIFSHVH